MVIEILIKFKVELTVYHHWYFYGKSAYSKALNNLKVCVVDGNVTRGRANVIDDDDESVVPTSMEHSDDDGEGGKPTKKKK